MRSIRRALLIFLTALAASAQVDVEEFSWGFNGKTVRESVNLLSVLMRNNSPMELNGTLTLQKSAGAGSKRGAQLAEPLYLSPGSSRWVQFYPFVAAGHEEWQLSWGRTQGASKKITISSLGVPGTIYIAAENSLTRTPKSVRSFNEMKFPVTVCATDALDAVILDHSPSWQKPRQRAFMDWLYRGGIVHLSQGPARETPSFPQGLGALNNPLPRFRVGAGTVIRHNSRAVDITEKDLVQSGFAPLKPPEAHTGGWGMFSLDTQALQRIGAIVRPDHNWGLIYLVALCYIVLVVPVNYRLGKKSKGYWRPLLFFLAMVVGCTLILGHIGRRGHGETTAMYTVGYARHLGDEFYDVTQWINAFVTKGDTYTVTHAGDYSLYITGQDEEMVSGVSRAGKEGSLTVDIPVFSRRPFIHRARMQGPQAAVTIHEWRKEEDSNEFQFKASLGDMGPKGIKWAVVCHDNHRYDMKVNADGTLSLDGEGSNITSLQEEPQQLIGGYGHYYGSKQGWGDIVDNLQKVQIHRVFGTSHFEKQRRSRGRSKDSAELFVLAESADGFACTAESFGSETSATLYHYTVYPEGG